MEKESMKTALLESNNVPEEKKTHRVCEELELKQDNLEFVLSEMKKPCKLDGVVVGKLVGFEDTSKPLIDLPSNNQNRPLPARSMVYLDKEKIGKEIAVMFEGGDPKRPIIIGIMQNSNAEQAIHIEIDGERKILTAEKEIVLRCGQASITMTRAGKIILRGTYVLSRSSGVNRIKGGSVQIN